MMEIESPVKRSVPMWQKYGFILTVYIALKPLYINASGRLQLADFFLLLGLVYIFFGNQGSFVIDKQVIRTIRFLLYFVIFVCLINGVWTISGYNYIRYSLYYIFNFLAVLLCVLVYQSIGIVEFKKAILNGAFLSSLVNIIGLIRTSGRVRGLGFFNNPNQLGYYGVVLIALVFLCKGKKYGVREIVIISSGGWSVISSLSKAAFFSAIIMFILIAFVYERDASIKAVCRKIALIIIIGSLIYIFIFTDFSSIPMLATISRMRMRIFNLAGERDSNLGSGRGYNRIAELGIHILWGMGEGNFSRFKVMNGAEVHSTYASIIVSYGLLGFVLYVVFLCKVMIRPGQTIRNLAIMSGVLLYSVSHNGVRNTLVWILLAAMFLSNMSIKSDGGISQRL